MDLGIDTFPTSEKADAVVVQRDGKIVVAGAYSGFGIGGPVLVRFNTNGGIDSTFGTGGNVFTKFKNGSDEEVEDTVIQSDGKIIIAGGYNDIHTGGDIALARFEGDPPPPAFDICLQDDGGGNLLQFNSTTGDYQFTTCSGFTIGGRGDLFQRGSTITLQHNSMDRRVLAMIDTGRWKGTASVRSLTLGHTFTITDRDARNNTCACR